MGYFLQSLRPWNTFGVTQYAHNIVYANSTRQLLLTWKSASRHNHPVLILGEGSNVLFLENFAGTVILNRIRGLTISEDESAWYLHTGSGVNWHKLVSFTIENNMPGLENLAFIPGCVGASPIQNIGAFCVEFKTVCEYVDCIELTTGKLQRLTAKECRFAYRDSIFKHEYQDGIVIIAVGLRLLKAWQPTLVYKDLTYLDSATATPKQIFNAIGHIRMIKLPDPKIYGNAGSFFKNPIISNESFRELVVQWPDIPHYYQGDDKIKIAAGWLIDKCQLKGVTIGGAAVYCKQALVLINENNATSDDIIQLARTIRRRVGKKFDIWLEPEVRFIGHSGEVNAVEIIA